MGVGFGAGCGVLGGGGGGGGLNPQTSPRYATARCFIVQKLTYDLYMSAFLLPRSTFLWGFSF